MASPRNRRAADDDPPMQKILCETVGSPEKTRRQAAADDAFLAALGRSAIDLAEVEKALAAGANPDRMAGGYPALHIAVRRQDMALLDLLLRYDAGVEDVDAAGNSALDAAYQCRFAAGIRALAEAGGKLRLTGCDDRGLIPEDGENYQMRIDEVMFRALRNGTAAEVENALALGADPKAVEYHAHPGYCALHLAIARCDPAKVDLLLAAGADVAATSGRGETSLDMLWWAGPKELLGDDWRRIYSTLEEKGARTLFSRRPSELTLNDLRRDVPVGLIHGTSALHFLVRMGKVDFVMEVIRRDDGGLTAEDLMRRSGYYRNETLLEAFSAGKRLADVFTAAVWQGRLEEMMSLRPEVDKSPIAAQQVDFEQARIDILRHRQKDLRKKALENPGLKLKPPPRKPGAP